MQGILEFTALPYVASFDNSADKISRMSMEHLYGGIDLELCILTHQMFPSPTRSRPLWYNSRQSLGKPYDVYPGDSPFQNREAASNYLKLVKFHRDISRFYF